MLMISRAVRTASLLAAVSFASAVAAAGAGAQEVTRSGDAALAREVGSARVSLARGLSAASARGKPISGKYELEDGKLQLSVYTEKGGKFWEVIVDHDAGRVTKAEEITGGEDLTAARSQSEAMAKATRFLSAAVARALRANPGYRAVSVTPGVDNGRAVATIRLARRTSAKSVSEPLN